MDKGKFKFDLNLQNVQNFVPTKVVPLRKLS